MVSLIIEERKSGKPDALRKNGMLPAVMYGPKEPSRSIALHQKEFEKVFKTAGESTIITLTGLGEEKEALITDIDVHPVTGVPRHVDFYVIEKGKKVHVKVPLEFVGESPAVKDLGGVLVKVIHELEMEVFPKDLPRSVPVDISKLATLGDKIFVRDLPAPASADIPIPPDEVVAMVTEAKEEAEEAPPAPDMSEIEVSVERGKKEEGGAEAEGAAKPAEKKEAKAEKESKGKKE